MTPSPSDFQQPGQPIRPRRYCSSADGSLKCEKIFERLLYCLRVIFEKAYSTVARVTQKAAHALRNMTMVNCQPHFGLLAAYGTFAVLCCYHLVVLFKRHLEALLKVQPAGAQCCGLLPLLALAPAASTRLTFVSSRMLPAISQFTLFSVIRLNGLMVCPMAGRTKRGSAVPRCAVPFPPRPFTLFALRGNAEHTSPFCRELRHGFNLQATLALLLMCRAYEAALTDYFFKFHAASAVLRKPVLRRTLSPKCGDGLRLHTVCTLLVWYIRDTHVVRVSLTRFTNCVVRLVRCFRSVRATFIIAQNRREVLTW
jgi:hypothetical protein